MSYRTEVGRYDMLTLIFHQEHVMLFRRSVKHTYFVVLKDGLNIHISKSDFDFIMQTRSANGEFAYRTCCRTSDIDELNQRVEYFHFIDETK